MAQKIINLINPKATIECDNERLRPKNSEVERLFGCNKKIKDLTEWKQNYSLDDGLKETIEWIKNNLNFYKADIYNI